MYIFVGTVMWVALLKSGVHATLAGVILAMFIPMRSEKLTRSQSVLIKENVLQRVLTGECIT